MNNLITRDWTIHETLQAYPNAASVFIQLKTNCFGCRLERFCTLEEAGKAYDIPVDVLLEDLISTDPLSCSEESLK